MTGFDHSEIGRLTADLGELTNTHLPREARRAVTVTARRVKDGWNGRLYTEGHASRTGRAVTYDLSDFEGFGATVIEAEIGPPTGIGRQAGVVRLLENGSVHNAPHGYGTAALHEQEGDFEHGLDVAARNAERAAGLG